MIEIKDGTIAGRDGTTLFRSVSFDVTGSRIVGVTGAPGSGKTSLLRAFLGLRQLRTGHVTINGEPLLPATRHLFVDLIGYLPQDLRLPRGTVDDLIDNMLSLQSHEETRFSKKRLMNIWQELSLDEHLYETQLADLTPSQMRRVALSLLSFERRPYLIIDTPTTVDDSYNDALATAACLHDMAMEGCAVLVATDDERIMSACNAIITLEKEPA